MPDEAVYAIAHIPVRTDSIKQIRKVFADLIEPTRREDGCVFFDVLRNRDRPDELTVIGKWASDRDLDAHFNTAYVHKVLTDAGVHIDGEMKLRFCSTLV